MTVVYNKRTGKIKMVCSGNDQHVSTLFGDESEDYVMIYDDITIPDDEYVIKHPGEFEVNIETRELEILTPITSYKQKK